MADRDKPKPARLRPFQPKPGKGFSDNDADERGGPSDGDRDNGKGMSNVAKKSPTGTGKQGIGRGFLPLAKDEDSPGIWRGSKQGNGRGSDVVNSRDGSSRTLNPGKGTSKTARRAAVRNRLAKGKSAD